MTEQIELWQQVENIKRRVSESTGAPLPQDFRSNPSYMAYTAMCAEAYWARQNDELDEDLLHLLEDSAQKAIQTWKNRGIHAES